MWSIWFHVSIFATFLLSSHHAAIIWNDNWAQSCDFIGNDLKSLMNTRFEDCSLVCIDTAECTHYTWLNGLCKLKIGDVFQQDAQEASEQQFCGVVQKSSGQCRNMWDIPKDEYENPSFLNICPVLSKSSSPCLLDIQPYCNGLRCYTSPTTREECELPKDSTIRSARTLKSNVYARGASLGGETTIWITGTRFAPRKFSLEPTSQTSNEVLLTNSLMTYNCRVVEEESSEEQIVCITPAMASGSYRVKVIVEGFLLPFYHYTDSDSYTIINVDSSYTPKINTVDPIHSIPGTLITLTGNFITSCFTRDQSNCAHPNIPLVTRIAFGYQTCELISPATNDFYEAPTVNRLKCRLNKPYIDYFMVSLDVSGNYGRSISGPGMSYVTTDDIVYNFQTHALIESVSPSKGSINGGTLITIRGKYLFHNEYSPAQVSIGNRPCKIVHTDVNQDPLNSTIVCETPAQSSASITVYLGNRGVTLIEDDFVTDQADFPNAKPSADSMRTTLSKTDVRLTSGAKTAWLKGFINPRKTSMYQLELFSSGDAILYVSSDEDSANKKLVASTMTYYSDSQTANVSLVKNKFYYFELITSNSHSEGSSLYFWLKANMFETHLTESDSSYVDTEKQSVTISSLTTDETYQIRYYDSAQPNATVSFPGTLQSLTMNVTSARFMLSFMGASTALLQYGARALQVQAALNDLPTLYENAVKVTESFTGTSLKNYTIEFPAVMGNVTGVKEVLGEANAETTLLRMGEFSGQKTFLLLEGIPSPLFSLKDAYGEIYKAVDQVFGVRCPRSISPAVFGQDWETSELIEYENECQNTNENVSAVAFCGKCSRPNQAILFNSRSFAIESANYICFAYKILKPLTHVFFTFLDKPSGKQLDLPFSIRTIVDFEWHYICTNIYTALRPFYNINDQQVIDNLRLRGARVYPPSNGMYIDTTSIRSQLPDNYGDKYLETSRRIHPSIQYLDRSLHVAKSSVGNGYRSIKISFKSRNCASNLPNFTLVDSFPLNEAKLTKLSSASPPVTGSFNISWNGHTLADIQANVASIDLERTLETLPGMGQISIKRTGDCPGYSWNIKWLSGGNKAPITIKSSALIGSSPTITSAELKNGGVRLGFMTDEMLRTYHTKPQATVLINGITSECADHACDYEWVTELMPTVDEINWSELPTLTIKGNNFDLKDSNNIVKVGNYSCLVYNVSATEIKCLLEDIPAGKHNFSLNVVDKGSAIIDPAVMTAFTFKQMVSSFQPNFSKSSGGGMLWIVGTGFGPDTAVTLDGLTCLIKFVNYSSLNCIIPSNPTKVEKLVDIVVNYNDENTTLTNQFTYRVSGVLIISEITPNILGVQGNELVKVNFNSGSLNSKSTRGKLGDQTVNIDSIGEDQFSFLSPPMKPGIYEFVLLFNESEIVKSTIAIEYRLFVTSFSPQLGSIRGGTVVELNGDGFSPQCSQNEIKFGTKVCSVLKCTKQWIQCQTSDAYGTHTITNGGADLQNGKGYAWNRPFLSIDEGDTVVWTWNAPLGSGVTYRVAQVKDATSFIENGFTSGAMAIASGTFVHKFTEVGVYHYWSDYIDSSSEKVLRGTIEVRAMTYRELPLSVRLNGFEAQYCSFPFIYNSISYSTCTALNGLDYPWCSPWPVYTNQTLRCATATDQSPSTCVGEAFQGAYCGDVDSNSPNTMKFTVCPNNSPQVNSVSVQYISFDDVIVIEGDHFSSTQCENEIYIGSALCEQTTGNFTTNRLSCILGKNSGLKSGVVYSIEVLVKNFGYALQAISYQVKFMPKVIEVYPTVGSTEGGTNLTITGDGFSNQTVVVIDNTVYSNSSVTYSEIVVSIVPGSNANHSIQIYVGQIEALQNETHTFEYSSEITPIVHSIWPEEITVGTEVTLTGENFGNDSSQTTVQIGNQTCQIVFVNDTVIICSILGLDSGQQSVSVQIGNTGYSVISPNISIGGISNVSSIHPISGSVHGGQVITLTGNGFSPSTSVTIGPVNCTVISVSINEFKCKMELYETPMQNGSYPVSVWFDGSLYTESTIQFVFDTATSPWIVSVAESNSLEPLGKAGDILKIFGRNFGTDNASLKILVGEVPCNITNETNETQISCVLGNSSAGHKAVVVNRIGVGFSNRNVTFEYKFVVSNISANVGTLAGGQNLTINGQGFSNNTRVAICEKPCDLLRSSTSQIVCQIPSSEKKNDTSCPITVTEQNTSLIYNENFNYSVADTPLLLSSYPARGGTGGGTLLRISGRNFPTDLSAVYVSIGGSLCNITEISEEEIQCRTEPYANSTIKVPIEVFVIDKGFALNTNEIEFEYIDLWSSRFTWGGEDPPREGEIAVIGHMQHIYFDAITPVLKALIIQGGSLTFDDTQDVSLDVEYILILDGGTLRIGTQEQPFLHNAVVTMHGHSRSIELPMYGAKVLGLREGTLDMHGKPLRVSWTKLGKTAYANSTRVMLKEAVNWPVGSQIVIATTGNKLTVGQSEMVTITGKDPDNRTLILDRPLVYDHLSVRRTVGNGTNKQNIYIEAEVGILSRNVRFQGNKDESWSQFGTAACLNSFDPGEFAVQSCFGGRYGTESGTDEFGAIIMIKSPEKSTKMNPKLLVRISNVELSNVGQSYRSSRHPINFNRNDNMLDSYIHNCSLHKTFNRAINIHLTNYLSIKHNFIYDIKGSGFVLHDGREIGNTLAHNLAIFVKPSASNEDGTPAAFMVASPNNKINHNSVAGCSHFGFWYRTFDEPLREDESDEISYGYRPNRVQLDEFTGNVVHSVGRYGLWIFPGYTPFNNHFTSSFTVPSVAKFTNLTAYLNDKAAEFVNSNSIQFRNFIVWDQFSIGIDTKSLSVSYEYIPYSYSETKGTGVFDSVIIGNSDNNSLEVNNYGLNLANYRGQLVKNISFINYPNSSALICTGGQGWTNQVADLKFENVLYKHMLKSQSKLIHSSYDNLVEYWNNIVLDQDGSLTGSPGDFLVYRDSYRLADPECRQVTMEQFQNGIACSYAHWARIRIYWPYEFELQNSSIFHQHYSYYYNVVKKNQEHHLLINNWYGWGWFEILIYGLKPNEFMILHIPTSRVLYYYRYWERREPITNSSKHNDWYWNNSTNTISFMIKNEANYERDINIYIETESCSTSYAGCPGYVPPPTIIPIVYAKCPDRIYSRSENPLLWSNSATWNSLLPTEYADVLIPAGKYILVDTPLPKLKSLRIEGVLEFDPEMDHRLEVDYIDISCGQLIIGWENQPMLRNVDIVFTGNKPKYNFLSFFTKSYFLGIFGQLDIHGMPRNVIWSRLNATVLPGASNISLVEPVDWQIGEEIVITTTSYSLEQTEIRTISDIDPTMRTLQLNASLNHMHLAFSEDLKNGRRYEISAGVGLLSRNIRIKSSEEASLGINLFVGDYRQRVSYTVTQYSGATRLSNVEVRRPGSNIYSGLSFENDVSQSEESFVTNCSFHHALGVVIDLSGVNAVRIENNVIHHAIESGIRATGSTNHMIKRNMVAMTYLSSTYSVDNRYSGAIDLSNARGTRLEGNFVAGAELIGIRILGDSCQIINEIYTENFFTENTVYGTATGIAVFSHNIIYNYNYNYNYGYDQSCTRIAGFLVFKASAYGIYYQGFGELDATDNLLIDNQIGVFGMVIGPKALYHEAANKQCIVRNSIIVGHSKTFSCSEDVERMSVSDESKKRRMNTFGAGENQKAKIGIVFTSFTSSNNGAPILSWSNTRSYSQISGQTLITNVTFANFDFNCDHQDAVISSNPYNDDIQHPISIKAVTLSNVSNASLVYLHRPNLAKINPSDCGDMDCDGLKNNLITDVDGSFLGTAGSVIPEAEFGWGSQQRGVGDFRIPRELLTMPNGSWINPNQVYNHPGISRNQDLCEYIGAWQAYRCREIEYKMVVIESMDRDTERRRLSPVAVLSADKYLNLLNGPQDYTWCRGHRCNKRISTFSTLLKNNNSYDIFLTATPPKHLRFRLLNANKTNFQIRLGVFYFTSQRIDLYMNGVYVPPSNSEYNSAGDLILIEPTEQNNFMPSFDTNTPPGTNFFDKPNGMAYFLLNGDSQVIDLKIAPVLFVRFGFPAVTPEQFFQSPHVVANIAALLGVSESKIRRVKIVREFRRRRDTLGASTFLSLVIEDNASEKIDDVDGQLTNMQQIEANVSNIFATGELQDRFRTKYNITLTGMTAQTPATSDEPKTLAKIARIVVLDQADKCDAQTPCQVQPRLMVADEDGNVAANVGTDTHPWVIHAYLNSSSNPNASLILQTSTDVMNGYANFTNLGISDVADSFVVAYRFDTPQGVNETMFDPGDVVTDPISSTLPKLSCMQTGEALEVDANSTFSMTISIVDKVSGLKIPDVNWNNFTWTAELGLYSPSYHKPSGVLHTNTTKASFDPSTGLANFTDLYLTAEGMYLLLFTLATTDGTYNFNCFSKTIKVSSAANSVEYSSELPPNYIMKFDGNFEEINTDVIKASTFNFMSRHGVVLTGMEIYSGSVFVSGYASTASSSLSSELETSGVTVDSSLKFVYLSFNDVLMNFTGVVVVVEDTDVVSPTASIEEIGGAIVGGVAVGAIVGGVVGGITAILLIFAIAFVAKKYFKKKSVFHASNKTDEENEQDILSIQNQTELKIKKLESNFDENRPAIALPQTFVTEDLILEKQFVQAEPEEINDPNSGKENYDNWLENEQSLIELKKKKKKKRDKKKREKMAGESEQQEIEVKNHETTNANIHDKHYLPPLNEDYARNKSFMLRMQNMKKKE